MTTDARIVRTPEQWPIVEAALRAAVIAQLNDNMVPLVISLRRYSPPRSMEKNAALYAHFRDIARHRYGRMDVPERAVEQVKDDFKKTDIWPRYSDAEPDYFTGEVLYRPKSCASLSALELGGILQWLDHYMSINEIRSHASRDDWAA